MTQSERPITSTQFVGRDVCSTCHKEESDLWKGSHHDLAMQVATEETVLGDFDNKSFTHFGITSNFYKRKDQFLVRTEGHDGNLHEYQVTHTFGVDPLQQYLVKFPRGRYQTLNLSWDTRSAKDGGQRWFHIYGKERIDFQDPLHWTGVYQTWNQQCAECHSTGVKKNYLPEDDTYQTTMSEIDVACESCHGPGSEHVAWAENRDKKYSQLSDPLMGLAVQLGERTDVSWIFEEGQSIAHRSQLRESQMEMETCALCHSHRSSLTGDYVHGKPLLDTHRLSLLQEGLYHPDGQIQDEVYVYGSFLQSKMYEKGVSCSDCHQPHSLSLLGGLDGVCQTCHLEKTYNSPSHHFHPRGSSGARCVECHMPARTYMVLDPRRDHSFRIPRPDLSLKLNTPNACTSCHNDRSHQWAADTVSRWYGKNRSDQPHFGEILFAGRHGTRMADRDLLKLAVDDKVPGIVRASALELLTQFGAPETPEIVRNSLTNQNPLIRLASVSLGEILEPRARLEILFPALLDPLRAIRLEAVNALADIPAQLWSSKRLRVRSHVLDESFSNYALQIDRPESIYNLGLLHHRLGNLKEAEKVYGKALAAAPHFIATYVNLVDLYRTQDRDEEGEQILRQGLEKNPENTALQHSLGLVLVRRQRRQEALAWFRRAAEASPEQSRYSYVYGIALQSMGMTERSFEVLEKAHHRHPENREILMVTVTTARQIGRLEMALGYAKKLLKLSPNKREIRNLIEQLTEKTQ